MVNSQRRISEIARYDLSEDGGTETAMIFGELYRHRSLSGNSVQWDIVGLQAAEPIGGILAMAV